MNGPLHGLKVIEMPAIGPVPFCGMLLADLGADVLRLDRAADNDLGIAMDPRFELLGRGKRSLKLDLKAEGARTLVLDLCAQADVLLEGFRPATMERLGLGPQDTATRNPRLIYGRMTGWGQHGPMAHAAGHDINYLALTGALHAIGRRDAPPTPPLNLAADFGGGSLYLAMGVLAALHERQQSGLGQVIDAAMVDGAASLMTIFYGLQAAGLWRETRGDNLLDSGAPWYDSYECADGRFVAVGALEPKFFAELCRRLGLEPSAYPDHRDRACWPQLRQALRTVFLTRTRDAWCQALEGSDACFAPVLAMSEAPAHAHMQARGTFQDHHGVVQPAAAPRFSRSAGALRGAPPRPGQGGLEALRAWGLDPQTYSPLKGHP